MLRSLGIKLGMLGAMVFLVWCFGWPDLEPYSFPESPPNVGLTPSKTGKVSLKPPGFPSQRGGGLVCPRESKGIAEARDCETQGRLNINTGTIEDLETLPGIGIVLAQRIVHRRTTLGRFGSIEELKEVKGIGEGRLRRLRPLITAERDVEMPGGDG